MPSITTRTLNPLPFDALEPKRFEDLIRQLAYDFRSWRMLEATGRSGDDEGYDARGFEIVDISSSMPVEVTEGDEEEAIAAPTTDRVWLIQCKREREITPAKMRQHLSKISEAEAKTLYGVIFAAACNFSKKTRDEVFSWARTNGISEVHIWGKREIEDQLFQPKNDNLLFAYFGISLQIRRRSVRTALRATLAIKRKAMRALGERWDDHKAILLRDPEDTRYPYIDKPDDSLVNYNWCLTEFRGHDIGGIKIGWRRYFAYLDQDGKKWDIADIFNIEDQLPQNPWKDRTEMERLYRLEDDIRKFWNDIPEECRGTFYVEALLNYDDILEIDERGDTCVKHPHVFTSFTNNRPLFDGFLEILTIPSSVIQMTRLLRPMNCPKREHYRIWKRMTGYGYFRTPSEGRREIRIASC
jgi:hypothetical protein